MEATNTQEQQLLNHNAEVTIIINNAAGDSSNILNATKTKKVSKIYERYDPIPNDSKHVRCKICKQPKALDSKGSSGNLNKHYERMHPSVCIKKNDVSNTGESASGTPIQLHQQNIKDSFSRDAFTQDDFERKLVYWIIESCQPFTVVEEESFKSLISVCNRKAQLVSAKTVKRRIASLYEDEKKSLLSILDDLPGKVSIIIDGWTSKNMHAFQGIILQYIDKEWNLQSLVLDLDHVLGQHTGENLANALLVVLVEFNIVKKLLAITTDNASNMDTMFTKLTELLLKKGIIFSEENCRVRCLAHIINLSCKAALSMLRKGEIEEIDSEDEQQQQAIHHSSEMTPLQKVKQGIGKIRKSTQRRETFENSCKLLKIQHKELILDMEVRWNTTYFMLVRVHELKNPFEATLRSDAKLMKYLLNDEDWKNIGDMIEFLKPFDDMTKYVSKRIPTMGMSASVYIELYKHLENCTTEKGSSDLIKSAAVAACEKLNKYYPSSDGLVYILGTVLDPRCKFEWYKNVDFDSRTIKSYRSAVTDIWTKSYKPAVTEAVVSTNCGIENADLCTKQMNRTRLDKRDELQRYLGDPIEAAENIPSNNILLWWKANEQKFKNLSRMARDFLAVSGTGVPVERFFSSGPDLLAARRLSLSPETIRMCLTLKAWIKNKNNNNFIGQEMSELISNKMLGETSIDNLNA